jgi:protein-disulfide isomerase
VSTVDDEQDLTRKQRREQAREARRELEQAQAASALRRTRLVQLGIVGVVVVAIIIGILVATGGGKKNEGLKHESTAATALINEVSALLGGIPESANTLGSPTAPVSIQYFGDLQCPGCKAFTLGALKPLIERDVRTGKLKIEYRSLETATRDPAVFKPQQAAAMAAGKQQRAWYYIELFYHQQGQEGTGYVNEAFLQGIAKQVPGLNLSKWASDRSNPEFEAQITSDAQASNNFGFTGTPSFAIGKTGGTAQKLEPESYADPASFEAAIRRLGG